MFLILNIKLIAELGADDEPFSEVMDILSTASKAMAEQRLRCKTPIVERSLIGVEIGVATGIGQIVDTEQRSGVAFVPCDDLAGQPCSGEQTVVKRSACAVLQYVLNNR